MRCRIGNARVGAPNFGLDLVPGLIVDLDQGLPNGGVLADVVRADWFEAIVPEARPRRRGAVNPDTSEAPASPAAEEDIHG